MLARPQTEVLTSQYGMRALTTREVAEGFQRAVVSGAPGSALLLHPGLSFYWPDTGLVMFNLYCWAAKLIIKVRTERFVVA